VDHILDECGSVKKQHNESLEKISNSKEYSSPKKNIILVSLE